MSFILLALCVLTSCSKKSGPETAGTAASTDVPQKTSEEESKAVAKIIQAQLPAAAQMPAQLMATLANSSTSPRISDFQEVGQPFSVLLLLVRSENAEALTKEELDEDFKYPSDPPKPSEFVQAFRPGPGIDQISVIQDGDIRSVTCQIQGNEATGIAEIKIGKLFSRQSTIEAKIQYRAVRTEEGWQITRLSLPAWGVETTRDHAGKWQASGAAVDNELRANLPRVEHGESPKRLANRISLFLWQDRDKDQSWVMVHGKKYPQEKWADAFAKQFTAVLQEKKISAKDAVAALRIDERISCANFLKLVLQLRAINVTDIRLVAGREESEVYPAYYEFPIHFPSASNRVTTAESVPSIEQPQESFTIRLLSNPDHRSSHVELMHSIVGDTKTGVVFQKLTSNVASMVKAIEASAESPLSIRIAIEGETSYSDLLRTFAACSGQMDENRKWTSFPVQISIVAPGFHDLASEMPEEIMTENLDVPISLDAVPTSDTEINVEAIPTESVEAPATIDLDPLGPSPAKKD